VDRYSTAGERSRARKGAENKIQTWKPGLDDQLAARSGLRALPYSLRLCCEGLEEKFLGRGAPAPLSVRLIHDFRVVQSLV